MRPLYPLRIAPFSSAIVILSLMALIGIAAPHRALAEETAAQEVGKASASRSSSGNKKASAKKSPNKSKGGSKSDDDKAQPSLVLSGAMNIGLGSHLTHSTINRNEIERSTTLRGVSGALAFATLHGVKKNFRLGGAFAYTGFQRYRMIDAGNAKRTFGQRLILDFLMEGAIPIRPKLDVLIGGRVGIPILIPGGDFKEAITVAMRQRYTTHGGPRFGLRLGLDFDVRYKISEVFALRFGAGYVYNRAFLLRARAESLTATGKLRQALDVSEIRLGMGFEWLY